MRISRLTASKVGSMFSVLVALLSLACGDDSGLAKRYSVSGKVTFKGQPVEKGRIDFVPEKLGDGRAAGGDIIGGSYSLTTAAPNDGALPGAYKVTISSVSVDTSELKAQAGGGQFRLGPESAKIMKKAVTNALPAKYQLADTSGLTAKVEERPNTIDFTLSE